MVAIVGDLIDFSEDTVDGGLVEEAQQTVTPTSLCCLESRKISRAECIASWTRGQENLTEDSLDVLSEHGRAIDRASVYSNSTLQSQILSSSVQSSDDCVGKSPCQVDNEEASMIATAQSPRCREQILSYTNRRLDPMVTAANRIDTNMSARQIDEAIENNLERVHTFFVDAGTDINTRLAQPHITPGVTKIPSDYKVKTSVALPNNTTAGWQRYAQDSGGYNVLRNGTVNAYHHERHKQDTGGYDVGNTSQPANAHTPIYRSSRLYQAKARSHVNHVFRAARIERRTHYTVDFKAAGAP